MKYLWFLFIFFIHDISFAAKIIEVQSGKNFSLTDFVKEINIGDVIIVGESHSIPGRNAIDQHHQVLLLLELLTTHSNVSVGMEFISYTQQTSLDLFLKDMLAQEDFLTTIAWGQSPFEDYKSQILLPRLGQGWTYGINSPREVTSFIGRQGLSNLPSELAVLLPPNFELGTPLYRALFNSQLSSMANHGINLDNYFEAQSVWDDTMAWQISEIMRRNPNQVLVVIVGAFHAMYKLGLPSRLNLRGLSQVKTLVQMSAFSNLSDQDLNEVVNNPTYGQISDFIW